MRGWVVPYPKQVSPHFSLTELASRDDPESVRMPNEVFHNLTDLCTHVLEPLRALFGSLIVTSGYRSVAHNRAIGGEPQSKHCFGMAVDIVADHETQLKIAAAASKIPECGGIGLYPGKDILHLDIRPRRPGGRVTIWEQINGQYLPISIPTHADLLAHGAQGVG
jgi:zinc D-Ala-D-Ala carboxypeptidase